MVTLSSREPSCELDTIPLILAAAIGEAEYDELAAKNNRAMVDNKKVAFGMHNFSIAALNIVTNSLGSALANGSIYYYDSSNVFLDSFPFACEFNYTIGKTILPDTFSSIILASNVVGRSGKIDFSPLTADLNIKTVKSGNNLHIKKFLLNGYWNGRRFSMLSVTGDFNFVKNLLNI